MATENLLFDDDHNNVDHYLYLKFDKREEILKRLRTATEKSRDALLLTYNGNDKHEQAIGISGGRYLEARFLHMDRPKPFENFGEALVNEAKRTNRSHSSASSGCTLLRAR